MLKKNPLAIVLGVSGFLFLIFVIVAVGTVMSLTSGSPRKGIFGRGNGVGVIEVKGVILDSKKLLEQIDGFSDDPLIKAVVIRINSPGGAVAPSQELHEAVRKLAKKMPVYASMASVAASGGYYVACGAKKIFASPGTITGSIGVIMQFADLSKLYSWAKINPYNVKTGKYKDIGSPAREMGPEEKALLQGMIDNVLSQFRRAVAGSRGLSMEKVVELSDGRIFSGEQAKTAKLVDELGGMSDVVEAVAKEAGIKGKPRVIYASKKKRAFERLLRDLEDDSDSESTSFLGGSLLGRLVARVVESGGVGDVLGGFGTPGDGHLGLNGPLFLLPQFAQ